MRQIFNPYFTTKDIGHGLGLSITHSIVHRHRGYLSVASVQNEGTTFEFYLPASEIQATEVVEPDREIPHGTGRILIMDDEELIHQTLGRGLRVFGYEVDFAYDGDEANQLIWAIW